MKIVTYLINLDGSDQRLASARAQLQQQNWEFSRFPAYDGRGKELSTFKNYDDAEDIGGNVIFDYRMMEVNYD